MRQPAIYIMANYRNGTLQVGVTSDLIKRAYEHKQGVTEGFTKRYGCKQLVYYEQHATMNSALEREQQIKSGSRKKKLALIELGRIYFQNLLDWMATRLRRSP